MLAIGLVSGIGVLWIQRTDALSRWQAGIIEAALQKLRGRLPFDIESLHVRKEWRELFSGRIASLDLVLRRGDVRILLSGPVDLSERKISEETLFRVTYDPEIRLEWNARAKPPPVVKAHIVLDATRTFGDLRGLTLNWDAPATWSWPAASLKLTAPRLSARWGKPETGLTSDARIRIDAGAKAVEWAPSATRTILVGGLALSADTIAAELNADLGFGLWQAALSTQTSEILWDDLYLDLPLQALPLHAEWALGKRQAGLTIGAPAQPTVRVKAQWDERLLLGWDLQTSAVNLAELSASARKAAPTLAPVVLEGWEIRGGTARLTAQGSLQLPEAAAPLERIRASAQLTDLSVRNPRVGLAFTQANLRADADLGRGQMRANLSVGDLRFKRLRGRLLDTPLRADREKNGQAYAIEIGKAPALGLQLDEIPLHLSALKGRWIKSPAAASADAPARYAASGSLRLDALPVARLLERFCVPTAQVPPAQVTADFSRIEFTEDSIDPTGKVRVDLFNGVIEADELGLFDYLSPVPELDFTVSFRGIELAQLGEWLNFGEMDGTLEGYAKDVTFQAWLPTHYDARFEARPQHHHDVVFSPDAMKNFARLAVSDGIDQLPGIVDWIAFGWPRRLLGGYDVDYVGISLLSDEGFIQVRTLDPPAIVAKEGKHFILYSDRFKMPLETTRYPLVIHATAVGNYVRRLFLSFQPKTSTPNASKGTSNEPVSPLPQECIPD